MNDARDSHMCELLNDGKPECIQCLMNLNVNQSCTTTIQHHLKDLFNLLCQAYLALICRSINAYRCYQSSMPSPLMADGCRPATCPQSASCGIQMRVTCMLSEGIVSFPSHIDPHHGMGRPGHSKTLQVDALHRYACDGHAL